MLIALIECPSLHLKTLLCALLQLFLRAYAFRPHVSDENQRRTRNFLKTLSTVEFFENAIFVFRFCRRKPELFENDDVSVLNPAYPRDESGGI